MSQHDFQKADTTNPAFVGALLDTIPTGIVVTNQRGLLVYANSETERLFGYSLDELLGESVDMLLPDRFSQKHSSHRQSFSESPSTRHMGAGRDLFGRRKNGSEFPLEVGLRPLSMGDENWVIATIVDISARKQLEARFAKVIEASPFGMLLVDEQGLIQLINPNLQKLFGYSGDELLGQSVNILLPERYRDNHDKLRAGYIAEPSLRAMGLGRDLTGRHKNGTEIPIEIGLNPVETDKGTLTLAVITDISERKRLELSLQQANAHMEEFTYVASHDLKSPLRGIADLVEWIGEDLDENTSQAVRKNLDRMQVRIKRMERLVEDLLLYARAGKRNTELVPVDLAELIKGIIEMHPVPPEFELQTDIRLHQITAARTPLETVLRNLFTNALKHHDGQAPQIYISAEADGNFGRFIVKDNGPGIPSAARERVFRLFQTLSGSESSGSGIGLAVAKRMTESHGGKIQLLENKDERGATFEVLWPRFPRKDTVE